MNVATIMTRDPLTVGSGASLDRAMDLMDEHDIRHLPVLGDTGLAGVISDRDVLEATGWLHLRQREVLEAPSCNVRDVMRTPAKTVRPEDSLAEVLEHFIGDRIGCLPVVREGAIAGLVTEVDILRAYADACRRGGIDAEHDPAIEAFMTRDPAVVRADADGDEAATLMRERGVRHVPVIEEGALCGIVSDRDVRRLRGSGQLEGTPVGEFMSPVPQTATPETKLSSAALILAAERISALPILSSGKLAGIVTTIDLMMPCAEILQRL